MEDNSLLNDNTIIKETPPSPTVTPGTFLKNIIRRLGFSLQTGPETASTTNNESAKIMFFTHSFHLTSYNSSLYIQLPIFLFSPK